uniref:Uncharacterized protein n=1 Tax=Arundo donax TaxID=35708 RepID=A0A0A9CX30_ARUDO
MSLEGNLLAETVSTSSLCVVPSASPSSAPPESAKGLADSSDDPSRYEIQSLKLIVVLLHLVGAREGRGRPPGGSGSGGGVDGKEEGMRR